MALSPDLVKQMKQLAKFGPAQIEVMLRELEEKDAGEWRRAVNLLVLTLWTDHLAVRQKANQMLAFLQQLAQGETNGAAQVNGEVIAPPLNPPKARIGADGAPISNPDQLAAEQLMDAVAGPVQPPRAGVAPPPVRGPRPMVPGAPPAGPSGAALQPRVGADGTVITDPQQLAAEQLMDDVLGT
jgi:hypothetical protein